MENGRFKVSMLEYSKLVLSKIRFDEKLFRKEYRKALRYLDRRDREALRDWVRSQSRVVRESNRSRRQISLTQT